MPTRLGTPRIPPFLVVGMILTLVSCSSIQLPESFNEATPVSLPEITLDKTWWQPSPGTSWQWQLTGTIDTNLNVEMIDLDLFDVPEDTIKFLHSSEKKVICYFSAGSLENWRPDKDDFPKEILGNPLKGWADERWLDIRALGELGPIMEKRLDLASRKGCDGVEPDNVDGYNNNTGFPLTYEDQIRYNTWLSIHAHQRGLSIGLKNDLDQIGGLLPFYDWTLNEECNFYGECDLLAPFVQSGKAVFGVEYELEISDFCPQMNALDFDFIKKRWVLDAWREPCR